MPNYNIVTDSCCDLRPETYEQLNLTVVPLSMEFRGQVREDKSDDSIKEVYAALRAGESAQTAAVNPDRWLNAMEPHLAEGRDVLVMAFSSGLSTTYQSAVIAAEELREKYPERTIYVVDTLCASRGEGLLVWYACKKRDEGMTLDELHKWVEDTKLHLCHWFTVDDLMYLKRGGRISAATALVGTMLKVKPVLHVDNDGHLINMFKVRGRKASLEAIANKLGELGGNYDNSTVFICHGDCIEDAEYVADLVRERFGVTDILINYVDPVIGAHSGPGTMALFFLASER